MRDEDAADAPVARSRNADARLAALYDEMLAPLFGFCRARLPLHDAEDVTAEVFRSALERLRADPSAELSPSWFFTAAQNRIIDRWRRDARWASRLELVAATERHRDAPPSEPIVDVVDALDRLSAVHRAVLVLHHVEGRPVREVADLIGRGPRAAESLLVRARQALLNALDAADVASVDDRTATTVRSRR